MKKVFDTTTLLITKKIVLTIIDVIGEETNKIYSKSVFNKEVDLNIDVDKSIEEIEKLAEGEDK